MKNLVILVIVTIIMLLCWPLSATDQTRMVRIITEPLGANISIEGYYSLYGISPLTLEMDRQFFHTIYQNGVQGSLIDIAAYKEGYLPWRQQVFVPSYPDRGLRSQPRKRGEFNHRPGNHFSGRSAAPATIRIQLQPIPIGCYFIGPLHNPQPPYYYWID